MAKKEIEQFDHEIDHREIILAIWNRKVFLIFISTLFAAIALRYTISRRLQILKPFSRFYWELSWVSSLGFLSSLSKVPLEIKNPNLKIDVLP